MRKAPILTLSGHGRRSGGAISPLGLCDLQMIDASKARRELAALLSWIGRLAR